MSKAIFSRPTSNDTKFKSMMDEISNDLDNKIDKFMKRHKDRWDDSSL